jgi:death on curing protein
VTPLFLTYAEVVEIHEDQISRYGGAAGIRDQGILKSAIAQAEATFDDHLLHPTLEAQAGAYLFHIVKNHPFIDGNKRAGTLCCLVFLEINGHALDPKLDEVNEATGKTYLEEVVLKVAAGSITKEELILYLKNNMESVY